MAKKEDDLDVLLPNWSGAAAHGFTISGSDDGIFIKDVVENSPVGKSGVMKEGDQIVSATIYFDEMGYEEAQKILQTVDRHTVGLKLHRKGEKLSPGGSYSWDPERYGATNPDAVLSGDDEDYQRIFRKKIKPRLKSEDGTEASDQGDKSSSVHITRKVITRTVHVTSPTVMTDVDIHSPEFKIKVPRHEQVTTEGSGPKLESSEMDVDVNLMGTEGLKFQMGDSQRTTHTMHIVKTKVVEVTGPDSEHSQTTFHMPHINITGETMQTSNLDVKIAKTDMDISAPNVDGNRMGPKISLPKTTIDISAPKVTTDMQVPAIDTTMAKQNVGNSDGKINMPSVKMPECTISGSHMRSPNVDINTRAVSTDVAVPEIDFNLNLSGNQDHVTDANVDVQTPKIHAEYSGLKMQDGKQNVKMKEPKFNISASNGKEITTNGGKIKWTKPEEPEMYIKTKFLEDNIKPTGPKIKGEVEMPDLHPSSGKIKETTFKIAGSKQIISDADLDIKQTKVTEDFDIPKMSFQGDIKVPNVNIKGPKVCIEAIDVKRSEPNIPAPESNLNFKDPKLKGDHASDMPSTNVAREIKRPQVNVEVDDPETEIEGGSVKFNLPKFRTPKFQTSGLKMEIPDFDIDTNLPEAEVKLSRPKIEGDLDMPDIDVDVGGSGEIQGPKLKIPGFNISAPNTGMPDFNLGFKGPKVGGDIDVPDVNLEGDIKGPNIDIRGPKVDIETPDVKGNEPKISMPSIHLPQIRAPATDLNFKGPNLKGDYDIDMPSGKEEGDIKGPKVDVDVDEPGIDVGGGSGKISMPKFKIPKFNMGRPKVEGPDVDIDAKLPEAEVKLSGPKVEGDIDLPDVEGAGKIQGPKLKMPEFNISAPNIGMPDFNLGFKGPKVGGDIDVPDVNLKGDIKGPNVDIKGPKVDIETPDVKGGWPKFSLPSVHLPHIKGPDIDFNIKGPNLKGDYDIDIPSGKVEGDIKGTKVDVDEPGIDAGGVSGKFSMPKFKMPKFNMGRPKVEGPDVDIDAKLPEVEVKLSGPKVEGDVDLPDVDVEGAGKIQGPKLKMPEFNISAPNIGMPDFNLGFKGPKVGGDIDVPDVNLKGDIQGPNVDIKGPKVDIETPDVKGSGPKFSLPSVHLPHIKAPDIDFNIKGPNLKGDYDIDMPSGKVEGDIKGPKVDVDVEEPGIDVGGGSGKFSMPKFKMPKFNMGRPKVEGPDVDIDAKLPKAEVKLSGPKIEGDIDMPDVDVEGAGKIQGPKLKMPGFNISAPNIGMRDFNLGFKGPKVGGDIDVPDVNLKGDIQGPNVDIKGPKVDIETPDVKGSRPKFSLPSVHLPHIKAPDFDFNIKGPNLKGDCDIDMPSGKIEGEVKAPKLDADVNVPGIDVQGSSGKFSLPKFKMPKFHKGGSKFEGPGVSIDANLPDADAKLAGPKIEGDVEIPDVDAEGAGKIKDPKLKLPGFDISAPKFGMSDFNLELKGPKLGGAVDVPNLNLESNIKGPNLNIKEPKVDLKIPDLKESGPKFSLPSIHLPHIKTPDFDLGFKGSKTKGDQGIEISSPNIDGEMKVPKIDVEAPDIDGQFHMPTIKMPKFRMGGTKVEGPDLNIDASVPEADVKIAGSNLNGGVDVPNVNLDADSKIQGPGFQMPGFNISLPKVKAPSVDFSFKGPEVTGGAEAPDMGCDIKGPNFEMQGPKVDIVGSDINIEGTDLKGNGHKFSSPSLDISALNLYSADMNLDLKGQNLKDTANIKSPGFGLNVSAPEIDIGGQRAHLKMPKVKKPKFGFGVKGQGDIKTPSVDVTGPEVDVSVDSPDTSVKTKGRKGKFKMPKLNIKSKKPGGDTKVTVPKSDLDLSKPDVEIMSPDLNVSLGSSDGQLNVKSSKVKKPRFGKVKLSFPDIEFDLTSKMKGELPTAKAEGDLQSPDVDFSSEDLKGPHINIRPPGIDVNTDANLQGPGFKVKSTKLKLPSVNIKSPKMAETDVDINLKGTNLKGEASGNVEGPTIDIKRPEIDFDVDAPNVDIEKPEGKLKMKMKKPNATISGPNINLDTVGDAEGKLKMPKLQLPSFGVDTKAVDTDAGVNLPKAKLSGPKVHISAPGVNIDDHDAELKVSGFAVPKPDIKGPKLNIKGPDVHFEGPEGKLKMPEMNISDRKLQGSGLNLDINAPKIGGDLKTPGLDGTAETSDIDINADGKFKGPRIGISAPNEGIDIKNPQLKGSINLPSPNIKGDFKELHVDVKGPVIDVDAGDFNIKGADGGTKMPQINIPKADINILGPKVKADNFSGSGVSDINVKGPTLATDVLRPKMDFNIKCPKVDIEEPSMKLDGAGINLDGLKGKLPSVNLAAPKSNIEFSGAKFEGDVNTNVPDFSLGSLSAEVPNSEVKIPSADMKLDVKGPTIRGGIGMSSSKDGLKDPEFDAKAPEISADVRAAMIELDVPLDKMKIPKFKHSQFKIKGPNLEEPEMSADARVPEIQLHASAAHDSGVNIKGPQASVNLPEGEVESSGVRIKKGRIKMPKFNFSKSKGKSSFEELEGDFSSSGPKIDIKGSKGSLGFGDIEVKTSETSIPGKDSRLGTNTSPKGKSGTLDFSLFKGKKSERHRSSSLSDEHDLSPSSPKGRLEFGEGAAGAKGKKSKLKFGTFGGFGAKSKGSYEVTLNESEAAVEGSGISLVSKKSRVSSTSSSDSGSRAGLRFPKVELNINKSKE